MSETAYCYHCGIHHPRAEMRQIETKAGKRWRCIRSIQATKRSTAFGDGFGKRVSAENKADAQSKARLMQNSNR